MTDPQTPSAKWDAMTDQEKIEAMAKVMGWERDNSRTVTNGHTKCEYLVFTDENGVIRIAGGDMWNPLENWNHTMEVVAAMQRPLDQEGNTRIGIKNEFFLSLNYRFTLARWLIPDGDPRLQRVKVDDVDAITDDFDDAQDTICKSIFLASR